MRHRNPDPDGATIAKASRREPSLYAFGTAKIVYLTPAEEGAASFEDRLRSCWRYLASRAKRYATTMNERERASYSAEDLIQEIVAALLRKDHLWRLERGRYCTFAERVARGVLMSRRERARIVKAPSNARNTLEAYALAASEGRLSKARCETLGDLRRLYGETEVCSPGHVAPAPGPPPTSAPSRELIDGLKSLANPVHALVLARTHGLFGQPMLNADELSRELGIDLKKAKYLQGAAKDALKLRITKSRGKQV